MKMKDYEDVRISPKEGTNGTVAIRKRVRQGCLLSPNLNLFNGYSETMTDEKTKKHHMKIEVNSEQICSMKFADDQAIIDR